MKRMTRFTGWIAAAILVAAAVLPQRLTAQASDGVKVHGHWVIEVRNADGTIAERREFQNALNSEGSLLLGGLLSGQVQFTGQQLAGMWAVILRLGSSSSDKCGFVTSTTLTNAVCATEAGHPVTGSQVFKTLTKVWDMTTGTFVLQGSVVMASAASITEVGTTVLALFTSTTGTPGGGEFKFTSRTLASPIAVLATQSVSITVTISFS